MLFQIKSTLMFVLILSITISGSVITFAQVIEDDQAQQQKQAQQIFGVRWFLGDYFTFTLPGNPLPSQQMFILMFNSEEQLDDQVYLKIDNTRYGCYERFLEVQSVGEHHYEHNKNGSKEGDTFTNALYRCIVYAQNFNNQPEVSYQIISGWTIFQGSGNKTRIKQHREFPLFEGKLRIPQNMPKLSFFFIADWGIISPQVEAQKGYKDVKPSMLKNLKEKKELGLILFGGDLAYDFQSKMYIQMLKYLQPLTSCIPLIVTPGNHDSVYHEDSLELYVQSFYTPMWHKYFNYFSFIGIEAHKLVIVSYDPQNYVFSYVNRLGGNLSQIFESEINASTAEYIKKNYDVMAFSHYPIYCSQDGEHYHTCEQNKNRFKPFMKKYAQMGLDIYLSGHLHVYERTKPICNDGSLKDSTTTSTTTDDNQRPQQYSKQCPIYVIQGDGGNNDFVQMNKRYQKKNFSQTIQYETGYGIMSVDERNLTYERIHVIDGERSEVRDRFRMWERVGQGNGVDKKEGNNERQKGIQTIQQRLILIVQVLALVIVAGLTACLLYKFYQHKNPSNLTNTNHVQMIQENFQTPPHHNKNQSKSTAQNQ